MSASRVRFSALRGWFGALLEPLVVIASFLVFGLGWAAMLGVQENRVPTPKDVREEAGPSATSAAPAPRLWLVDGYNVLHAGVLRGRDRRGWWTVSVQSKLIAIAETFEDPAAEIIVVFDAAKPESPQAPDPPPPSRVRLVYAPSADDWMVRHVRSSQEPERIAVVTADRQVQGRARHGGAKVVAPLAFLSRCSRSTGNAATGSHDAGG